MYFVSISFTIKLKKKSEVNTQKNAKGLKKLKMKKIN